MATVAERQHWMGTLAKAALPELEQCVLGLGDLPSYEFLRSPETGLAMVRGQAGGSGDAFNLGEITLTRCVVSVSGGQVVPAGFGYVKGRSHRHAELAAVCDALLQQGQWHERVMSAVVKPLQQSLQRASAEQQQQTAATKVEFFTMRRGE
ncbi:MAG: phosphonate C-P lyase system protein PhnG [Cyanobacteria bacterium J06621_3]